MNYLASFFEPKKSPSLVQFNLVNKGNIVTQVKHDFKRFDGLDARSYSLDHLIRDNVTLKPCSPSLNKRTLLDEVTELSNND